MRHPWEDAAEAFGRLGERLRAVLPRWRPDTPGGAFTMPTTLEELGPPEPFTLPDPMAPGARLDPGSERVVAVSPGFSPASSYGRPGPVVIDGKVYVA